MKEEKNAEISKYAINQPAVGTREKQEKSKKERKPDELVLSLSQ